jgi:hypothetical protein
MGKGENVAVSGAVTTLLHFKIPIFTSQHFTTQHGSIRQNRTAGLSEMHRYLTK